MLKNYKKGFTLIELLVVIAIIGILSSVVLASLNAARSKGSDAAIKANLNSARPQSELFYDPTGSYLGVCTAGVNNISTMILAAAQKLNSSNTVTAAAFAYSGAGAINSAVCHDSALGWAAIVSLKNPTTPSAGWCVDSTGVAKEVTALVVADISCN